VQRALDRLAAGRLTVSVTHRLANLRLASSIVVLDKGRVVGTGSHEELLRSCDTYRRLWIAQAGEDFPAAPVAASALLPS
jgi:ABC-type multidrug transport system fused ATPase/permease subunit